METEEAQRVVPFQLQLDKPIASQIKIAEWNPEKDLLAMVTEDSKILLHRFKWQRLWTISPGKSITSLCWRPDGKAIAVGIEDGTVSLCDVEDDCTSISTYEDRTSRFLPPAPRVPQMLGVAVLTKDLCCLVVTCSEELTNNEEELENQSTALHEVISASLSVMRKQWSDAMHTFYEKFDSLSNLINDHGIDSSPQEEFLSLLGGARTSPPLPQFLVNSLGEVGVKRVSKVICGAGKELQLIVQNHLQPAAEIIGFRMGELRGLSRWHACYQVIGLDETLIDNATEKFSNFFNWLLKCIKLLMWEPSNQLLPYNSEHVVVFLKFLYEQDPVRQLLEASTGQNIDIDLEMMQRAKELVQFGGFSDCEFLQRTLAKGFHLMESYAHFIPLCCLLSCYRIFKEVFVMPFTSISKKILCEDLIPLFPHTSSSVSARIPMSVSYYKDASHAASLQPNCKTRFIDYISFQLPDESLPNVANCIRIVRGFTGGDIVLLLNETTITESSGDACIIIVEAMDLPFTSISRSTSMDHWKLHQLKEDSVVHLGIENEKVCSIPRTVMAPFAVSSSRGLACVFAARKRALVYILEEDEDEVSDAERSTS